MTIQIEPIADSAAADEALEALLHESYVGGGFTAPEVAATTLRAAAVRSRGTVLVAHDGAGAVLGSVTLVKADSPARRLASAGEQEIHLLCVRPDVRRSGVGRALVQDALTRARASGARGVVLWTQPTMGAAQRLYEQCGFRRDASADFAVGSRDFLVYRRVFEPGVAREPAHRPDMKIRVFRPEDEQRVTSLWERCGLVRPWNDPHKDIARKLRVQAEGFLVGVIDDELVATVMVGYDGHRGWINYLAVAPEHQGTGLGRQVMDEAERILRASGCPKINLQVRTSNTAVLDFYRSLGYAEDDVVSLGKRLESDAENA
jgi:ribosomal protein S18 acetylase RimI-like enzyme